jgi:hypothetical protein
MRIANATNGLAFPPFDGVSMFLSTHGHNYKIGYFRIDAMPWNAVIHLLTGGEITVVDATPSNKELPDSFRFGVTTWALAFNRAIRERVRVAGWQTKHMAVAANSRKHKPLVQRIRRLKEVYGSTGAISIGKQVKLEIHRGFENDDKPRQILEKERKQP